MHGLVIIGMLLGATCPRGVSDAVKRAHPDAKIISCKQETSHGKTQYEVKVGKMELEVSREGEILKMEEAVPLDSVPREVRSTFQSRYPGARLSKAEKQTLADGAIRYELAFKASNAKHEATFDADGTYLEEE